MVPLQILLFEWRRGHWLIYAERPRPDQVATEVPRTGIRGWLDNLWSTWRDRLHKAEGGAWSIIRRIEGALRRLERPDEPVLRALRAVNTIELIHPARLTPKQAQRTWRHYLHQQGRRHTFWLVVNLLISPLTILLAILPGPNVIGYWFVYRAVCNGLAMLGARRGLGLKHATRFTPEALLDTPLDGPDAEFRAARIAERWGLTGLREFLGRLGVLAPRPESAPQATQAPAIHPPED